MATAIDVKDANGSTISVATLDALIALFGAVAASPAANTVLARLKAINDTLGSLEVTTSGLTNDELRASAVPVSGPLTDTQLRASAVPVSGPLTDTQLRASAVPVSLASAPLPTGAATSAKQDLLKELFGNTTDAAWSGTGDPASIMAVLRRLTTLLAGTLTVTGGLTDTQLRASDVPVSVSSSALPSGAATAANQSTGNSTLASILSTLQAQVNLSTTLWTDDSGDFYVRRDIVDQDDGTVTVTFTDPSGAADTPGAGLRPASNEEALYTDNIKYLANTSGTGYSSGDTIVKSVTVNQNTSPPTVVATFWLNLNTGAIISEPTSGHLDQSSSSTVTVSSSALPAGAATAALQGDIITALTGIGLDSSLQEIVTLLEGTLAVSASSLPLPTGAASSSLQSTLNGLIGAMTDAAWSGSGDPASLVAIFRRIQVLLAALPLPTGASTAALQTTLNGLIGAVGDTSWDGTGSPASLFGLFKSIRALLAGTLAISAASLPLPSGAATSAKQDTAQASLDKFAAGEYETVAASATDQVIGASGAAGDFLASLLIVPATTSPGAVSIKDGSGGSAITVFTGGASSVSNLVPFAIPLGLTAASGGWRVTTGTNVSAIASGNFT